MSALNDSRNVSGQADYKTWQNGASLPEIQADLDSGFDAAYPPGLSQRNDAYDPNGFTVEHQIRTLRQIAERHERQIVALTTDKHEHCNNLATVFQQLEKVLEKFKLPSLTSRDGQHAFSANLPASLSSGSPFPAGDDITGHAADSYANKPASFSQKRSAEGKLDELLCHHRDQVFDVLADYRKQIEKSERETKRRLDAVEQSTAHLQSDVKELLQLLRSAEENQRSAESRHRDDVRELTKQLDAQKTALDRKTNDHTEKVQHCCDALSACLAQLSEETKSIKAQQQRSEKELDRQIRSIVVTEQQVAEVLERQSHSITRLETQDSLEGAFHEVKDWLGDLEKRMVSRGELLKWTESLQQEMNTLRRLGGPLRGTSETSTPSRPQDQ
ncbi:hypothetical protein ABB37_03917 [Leptomonas pyrrhocoris]|uniref:Uncharacterized protein n=1 Tax=Leptomonas pyrrhocoris TaxID=157538 RepID=A0A0N0VFP3_LEPPY|nr:hypothetical protein ABB37_03917 [Leptomonas pyrrhocoris]KPA81578.1 hypothetical protein ABB37_03917 [Leptomonas pyrrhocoris]|eukprot:XP_015660017.1 hypothetical protein ABB37_03917 [Leptomonas pyrrhocoris]